MQFNSVISLYGEQNFKKIQRANILVLGVGGVGSWVAQMLIRSGIQQITIVDADEVCKSNINRQAQANFTTIGKLKVEALKQQCLDINPNATINAVVDFISLTNMENVINNEFNCVLDCIDNARIKAAIMHFCTTNNIFAVFSGAAGGKTDISKIKVADLAEASHDKLLTKTRTILRKDYGFARNKKLKLRVVYSAEQSIKTTNCSLNKCDVFGSISHVTVSFAMNMVQETLHHLINKES